MNDEVHDILADHLQNRASYNLKPNFQIKRKLKETKK